MRYLWRLHPGQEHRENILRRDQVKNLSKETNWAARRIDELEREVAQLQRPAFRVRIARHGQNVLDTGYIHPRTSWQGGLGNDGFVSVTWWPEEPADE